MGISTGPSDPATTKPNLLDWTDTDVGTEDGETVPDPAKVPDPNGTVSVNPVGGTKTTVKVVNVDPVCEAISVVLGTTEGTPKVAPTETTNRNVRVGTDPNSDDPPRITNTETSVFANIKSEGLGFPQIIILSDDVDVDFSFGTTDAVKINAKNPVNSFDGDSDTDTVQPAAPSDLIVPKGTQIKDIFAWNHYFIGALNMEAFIPVIKIVRAIKAVVEPIVPVNRDVNVGV